MLSPEILNFDAPESSFTIERSSSSVQVVKKIQSFAFPHLVTLTVPDPLRIPESLTRKFFSNSRYYKISNFALGDLVNRAFISCFVKRGSLSLLSIGTRIDCDSCVTVTPEGYLILNIDKQTFQTLGLEGKPSHFHRKTKDRFVVTVNLNLECLRPGKTIFERTKFCLNKLGRFTVILKWEPPVTNPDVCPSSIAKYFVDLNYDVSYSDPVYNSDITYSVKVPNIDLEKCDDHDVIAFSEWLGLVALKCPLNNEVSSEEDNYLSSYKVPEPNSVIRQINVLQWRGLFSSRQIEAFFDALKNYVEIQKEGWITMYVQGFSDSVVSWNTEEHHFYTNGDDGYLVIFNDSYHITCTLCTSKKQYK